MALLVPCAELVRDGRADDTVDVAVGTAFSDVNPGRAVRDALDQLGGVRLGTTGSGNADPAAGNAPPPATPVVDPSHARRGPRGDLPLRPRSFRCCRCSSQSPAIAGLNVIDRRAHRH